MENDLFEGHAGGINSVKFTRNKLFAASAGCDRRVLVWDLLSREVYVVLNGHNSVIWKVLVTHDDEYFVLGDFVDGVRVWSIEDKKQVFLFKDLNESKEWLEGNKGMKSELIRFLGIERG